jgi:hypothetical protein
VVVPINVSVRIKSLNPEIKEAFMVKLKMIFVNYYFCPHQTQKNVETIFQITFYSEINGA